MGLDITLFDLILSLTLIFLALQLLRAKDIFVSVVLFIVFGLLMALAWVQLEAPDIALVEAAIGAGVTGALFLGVLGRMESISTAEKSAKKEQTSPSYRKKSAALLFVFAAFLAAFLCWSVFGMESFKTGLTDAALSEMFRSGVENPVTAVILNFRAYDTLMEIGVLLLVAIAVYSLFQAKTPLASSHHFPISRILTPFMQIMAPFMVLFSFYLLWRGSNGPGGAFQAGAILGGIAILLTLNGGRLYADPNRFLWRSAVALGFAVFMLAGLCVMTAKRAFLEYPPNGASQLILLIESVCALSIAVIFFSLFKLCSAPIPTFFLKKQSGGKELRK